MRHIYFGADPEYTLFDKDGNVVPAHRVGFPEKHKKIKAFELPGNKYILADAHYTSVHRDGVNVEFNPPPTQCRAMTCFYMRGAHRAIKSAMPEGVTLRAVAAYKVDLDNIMSDAPDDVHQFGCEPAFSSYTGEPFMVDINAEDHEWRYAGGHMHAGTNTNNARTTIAALEDPTKYLRLGQIADWLMGIPMTVIWNNDEQFLRREHYGKAGEFRPQKYGDTALGFEYRTPPPDMWNHQAMVSLFYGVFNDICVNFDKWDKKYNPAWGKEIQKAINENKSPEKFLAYIPGWYTPETIIKLRGVKDIFQPAIAQHDNLQGYPSWMDFEQGWTEFSHKWGLDRGNKNYNPVTQIAA